MSKIKSVSTIAGVFAVTALSSGYAVAGEGISVLDGKCGAGKCGSNRVRTMMDSNSDGQIDRSEYVAWASGQASREFDAMSHGKAAISSDDVYKHFEAWQSSLTEAYKG